MTSSAVKRQRLFTAFAFLIPFIVLFAFEAGLRLTGFGKTVPLYVPAKGFEGYVAPNPELIKRYFHLDAPTPKVSPDTVYFKLQKPTNTLRIVLMGGSTAAGFPYGRFGSPAGLLTHQIRAVYPQLDIEVIPVAMASINSYALRDLADEVAQINPDAVLIYAGHNEYLGVMGVGSAYASYGNHLTNMLFLKLKDLRLFQLAQSLFNNNENQQHSAQNNGRTTMALMAKEQNIPYDSDMYHAGIGQFTSNVNALVDTFVDAEIPVLLANLVANEKDQRPFSSNDPEVFAGITPILSQRLAIEEKLRRLTALEKQAPASANIAFTQGALLNQQGKTEQSIEAFTRASDLDQLRFRAPSAFNTVIDEISKREGIHKVDMQTVFHADSQGPIGNDHMLEHLHPTVRGYFLMADTFLQGLVQASQLPEPTYPLSKSQKLRFQQVPINDVEKGIAEFKIRQLKSDYPFTDSPKSIKRPTANNEVTRFINERLDGRPWLDQQQALLSFFQKNRQWLDAANVAALIYEAIPNQHKIAKVTAKLYLKAHQPRLAWYYARQASSAFPKDQSLLLSLAESQYLSEDNKAAQATLERILSFAPDNERAAHYLKQLQNQ
jgi:tetratricopeptide (TPR) repeat protein